MTGILLYLGIFMNKSMISSTYYQQVKQQINS